MIKNNRLFIVCDILLERRDAPTIHVMEVFKNLARLYNTYLFVPRPKRTINKVQNIIFVPSIVPVFKAAFYQISLIFYLIYHCLKHFPNAIYSRYSSLTFSPLLISKIFQIPYVVEVNGLVIKELEMNGASKLGIKIARLTEKLNYKNYCCDTRLKEKNRRII